ncbi:MAG: hypothetical protein K6A44_00700 [bacterium]|nr:hypothetical protein [bacterium]
MGIMLYQVNPALEFGKDDYPLLNNIASEDANSFSKIILFEYYHDNLSYLDKNFGLDVKINPLKKLPFSLRNKCQKALSGLKFKVYSDEENRGLKCRGAKTADICLARYARAVAENMNELGGCYTGVKHALLNAGVISDYGDMPKGSAYKATDYFDKYPDRFRKIKVKKEDLTSLPAGKIIVYKKEGKDGHIAITNGNRQEMSDCTDNMKWLDEYGEGASFSVYELTDNWVYDKKLKKLVFKENK